MWSNDGRINILFVIMQMEMGGAERLVHNLAMKLDRRRFNPSIAWFNGDVALKEFADLNILLCHVPKVKRFDFSTMKRIGEIIREHDIHIVNAQHFMPMIYSFYGSKIKNRIKLFATIHSEWEIESIPLKWRLIGGLLLKRTEGIIGVSQKATGLAQRIFRLPASKTITIENGIDLDSFNNGNRDQALKRKLGIAEDEKVIGVVANLKKIKNHLFLLNSFRDLVKRYNSVKLLLIGQGFKGDPDNTEQELRDFVKANGLDRSVLFLGYRPDIHELLGVMDVFCLTSFKEGLPISLIEAMASGLPVIGTDVEGIKDVIIPNKNGLLISPDDTNGLSNALYALLQNDKMRIQMGKESRELATGSYSLKECVRKYQDLFTSAVKNDMVL